jgi:hypothetical protein
VLPRKMLVDAKHRRRFEREARLAAKLHHTNIVPVFGVGEHDGLPYYVMQFIQDLGLDQVLEELKRLRAGSALGHSPCATNPGRRPGVWPTARVEGRASFLLEGNCQGRRMAITQQTETRGKIPTLQASSPLD